MKSKSRPITHVDPPELDSDETEGIQGESIEESPEEFDESEDSFDGTEIVNVPALVEARATSPTDPLRRYMEEVARYPFLDAADEVALGKRLVETGDIEAAKQLVSANLRLVVKIAYEYQNYHTNIMDMIQEGNIGLMNAVSKFDPTKGVRLGYYATWWIRSYILKYLLDNFRMVKIGTTQAQKKLFYHLVREKERIEAQGLTAGPKLLADRLQVKEKEVIEMQQRLLGQGAEMSLDQPMQGDDSQSRTSFKDQLVAQQEAPDEQLAHDQLLQIIRDRLPEFEKSLNDREQKILHERWLSETPKTLQEVADQYGLTRERVRQIESKLISKLKSFLKSDLSDLDE